MVREGQTIQNILTIIVNAAPRFATILCRWFGRLAMPIGEADSIDAGAILDGCSCCAEEGGACDRVSEREACASSRGE